MWKLVMKVLSDSEIKSGTCNELEFREAGFRTVLQPSVHNSRKIMTYF
jgi:hypothetical protein